MKLFRVLSISLLIVFIAIGCGSSAGNGDGDNNMNQTPTTTVSGKVLDKNSNPIAGAKVTITSDPVVVFTDSDGNYTATVEIGDHSISITVNSDIIYSDTFTCYENTPLVLPTVKDDDTGDGDTGGGDTGGGTIKVSDTGQTKCYNGFKEITCPSSGDPFYGQDAQYTSNPMSFKSNGNGTVTDNITGLVWQQQDDNILRNWSNASAYCNDLSLAGHSDWRTPDEFELLSIAGYSIFDPAIDTAIFVNMTSTAYWSATSSAEYDKRAWYLNSEYGIIDAFGSKTGDAYVLCVRGAKSAISYTNNGNGTVTDNVTGLMWQREDDNTTLIWEPALKYCEDLTLAGYTDWKVPNIKELSSIIDNTMYSPAINSTYFPNTKASTYWSSTTTPSGWGNAWTVYFRNGTTSIKGKYSFGVYLRCVRLT